MGGLQNDRRRKACLQCLPPADGAQAPAVARFEPGKTILGLLRDKVIAAGAGERQKLLSDPHAHQMRTHVRLIGSAAAVAEITGDGVVRTGHQLGAKNIFCVHYLSYAYASVWKSIKPCWLAPFS